MPSSAHHAAAPNDQPQLIVPRSIRSMHRKWLILGSAALAIALLFLCTFHSQRRAPIQVNVDISHDVQDGQSADTVLTLSVTNTSSRPVKILARVNVTYLGRNGGGATDYVSLAGSGTDIGGLSPNGSDSVVLKVPDLYRGVQLRFDYTYAAGPFPKAVGLALNKFHLLRPPLSATWIRWLLVRGMIDGKIHAHYDETWPVSVK